MKSSLAIENLEMNTIIIKSVSHGDFEEISIHMPDWQAQFRKLVQEEKPIRYDVYTMPNLAKEIQEELSKRGYRHLILDSDKDQHFLAPKTMTCANTEN
jgi:hypothetical protein